MQMGIESKFNMNVLDKKTAKVAKLMKMIYKKDFLNNDRHLEMQKTTKGRKIIMK